MTRITTIIELEKSFQAQKHSYAQDRIVAGEIRIKRLDKLISAIEDNEALLIDAVNADFGSRSRIESMFGEIVASLSSVRLARKNVKKWMKTRTVSTPIFMRPGRSRICPQPLGVVGIISPWNYPIYLAVSPLASALAAGNRVLLKPSELTPHTSVALKKIFSEIFDETEVAVIIGGADIGAAFAQIPFDHLLFTGSTAVGQKVAEAAVKNLTPVTLELGGKSPAIIDNSAHIEKATQSIAFGKAFNAGQTCVAPDYVLTPHSKLNDTVNALKAAVNKMYPDIDRTSDYSSIISDRHYSRLESMIFDAKERGIKIIQIGNVEKLRANRKLPFTIVVNPPRDSDVMREEIFGPILPVIGIDTPSEAIEYVNEGDRPLALYWFGASLDVRNKVLGETVSGGVTVNDTNWHVVQENLPFGGVGKSGNGVYHGESGFETFSQMKPVFLQSRFANTAMLQPPYNRSTDRLLKFAKKFM
ncbi:MAG: coniferyl aldehyde dehydrogenase [Robiginitomaculum sp.]|nr:MAG: coniferyl aldehyde dehydrogenase [Robiginitomaculum sp.]